MITIVCTVDKSVQTGMDEWSNKPISKLFSSLHTIEDMLEWANTLGHFELFNLHLSVIAGEEWSSSKPKPEVPY